MYEQPMSFWKATALFWSNYFNFSGRSRRKEYWVPSFTQLVLYFFFFIAFIVFTIIIATAAVAAAPDDAYTSLGILSVFGFMGLMFFLLICLVLIIPNLSLLVRRLHDTGRSGKWALLFYLVPMILSWISMIINNFGNQQDPSVLSFVFQLIAFVVNLVLAIWCIVWCAQDSEPGTNKWGPNPKAIGQDRYYNPYQQNDPISNQYNDRYQQNDPYRR